MGTANLVCVLHNFYANPLIVVGRTDFIIRMANRRSKVITEGCPDSVLNSATSGQAPKHQLGTGPAVARQHHFVGLHRVDTRELRSLGFGLPLGASHIAVVTSEGHGHEHNSRP